MEVTKINTSKKLFDEAKVKTFAEIGKLKEGTATHRVITGPILVETIWYPTVAEKDGKVAQSMRTIVRPSDGCILDEMAILDEKIMKAKMVEEGVSADDVKKYRSALRPQRAFRFLVFDRDADNEGTPTVRVYDYPKTIKEQLESLQGTMSKKHPGYLEYGLVFMYDCYFTKTIDKDKSATYGTDYKTAVVTDTLPLMKQMKIPVDWLNWTPDSGKPCPWKFEDFFTEDELKSISDYDKDLETLCKPDSEDEIAEKLTKNPIYLEAKFMFGDRKGETMFPMFAGVENRERLLGVFNTENPPLLMSGEDTVDQPEVELPKAKEVKPISVSVQPEAPKAITPKPLGLMDKLKAKAEEVKAPENIKEVEPTKPAVAAAPETIKPAIKKLWSPVKK